MRALAKKMGGNATLGRALGYRDGAYVGQMIGGLRPITEKTVEAAEALPGARGWFAREQPDAPAVAAPASGKGLVYQELTDDEKAFMHDFRTILGSDRRRIAEEVARKAAEMREWVEQHEPPGVPLVARPKHAPAKSRATQQADEKQSRPLETTSSGRKR